MSPNEHVLGRQRDLLVTIFNVCAYGLENPFLGQVDLRVEVRHAELASASAAGSHFDDAERRGAVRKDQGVPVGWVVDHNLLRQNRSLDRLPEQPDRLFRLTPTIDDAVDPKPLVGVRLCDLPASRTAQNDRERFSVRAALDRVEQLARVVRVDRLTRTSKDRCVHPRGECHAQRVVCRDCDDLRVRTYERVDIVRVAHRDVVTTELIGHHTLENP